MSMKLFKYLTGDIERQIRESETALRKTFRSIQMEQEEQDAKRELLLPVNDELTKWVATEGVPFAASVGLAVLPDERPIVRVATVDWLWRTFNNPHTLGMYSSAKATDHIVMSERHTKLDMLLNQSVMVHEAAHWLQPRMWGGFDEFHSRTSHEKELGAYRAQLAYIAYQGVKPRELHPGLFGVENLFYQTRSDELFRNNYAWLQPWSKLGEYRRAAGLGATLTKDNRNNA